MQRRILNRSTADQILRFFDVCFKQGVIDACEFGDDWAVKDFYEKHIEDWDFGVLGEADDMDWELFRVKLYHWGRERGYRKFLIEYVYQIHRKNYAWYFFVFCMRFYLLGIGEWLEYPNSTRIEQFKNFPNKHWVDKPSALAKISKTDKIVTMQDEMFKYCAVPEEDRRLSVDIMDSFCRAIHDLTRPLIKSAKDI